VKFAKPTIEELRGYAKVMGYTNFDPEVFHDYYETVGWKVGNTGKPMICWQAAVRQWVRRQREWSSQPAARPSEQRSRAKRIADWEAALRDVVLAVWPHHNDREEVRRMLRAARDKYADLGRSADNRTVAEAALEIIRAREASGWGGC
jgi:hypothetical protein